MPIPAQTPHLVNNAWIVFIKDSAFSMIYDIYLRNFDVNDRQRKEYSVLWFRQMWKKLNDLAGTTHPLALSIEDIDNSYNPSRPLYGKLQFEPKIIYSMNDGKYYHILVVDSFNYTLPYTDYYGGKRVIIENKRNNTNTMKNTLNRVRLTESQLHNVIKESVRQVLSEMNWKTYQSAAKKAHLRACDDIDPRKDNDKYQKELGRSIDFRKAAENAFNNEYGTDNLNFHSQMHGSKTPAPGGGTFPYNDDSYIEMIANGSRYHTHNNLSCLLPFNYAWGYETSKYRPEWDRAEKEMKNYKNGNYEYDPIPEKGGTGKGWHLKDEKLD